MNGQIDPIEFGKLLTEVKHLSHQLAEAQRTMDVLTDRLEAVEDRYKLGKAGITGLVIGLGFTIYGLKEGLTNALGWLSR